DLRVQLRRAQFNPPAQLPFPFLFLSFSLCCQAPGASPVFPARWNPPQPACVPRCTLCLQRLPWRVPAGFSLSLLFVSLLSSVAKPSLRELFFSPHPARE